MMLLYRSLLAVFVLSNLHPTIAQNLRSGQSEGTNEDAGRTLVGPSSFVSISFTEIVPSHAFLISSLCQMEHVMGPSLFDPVPDATSDRHDEAFFLRIEVRNILETDIPEGDSITSQRARLHVSGVMDERFSSLPSVYFSGIEQSVGETVAIRKVRETQAIPTPISADAFFGDFSMGSMPSHWYGEQEAGEGAATATLSVKGTNRVISGSIFDGKYTYRIDTIEDEHGGRQYECRIIHVNELPGEIELTDGHGVEELEYLSDGRFLPFENNNTITNTSGVNGTIVNMTQTNTTMANTTFLNNTDPGATRFLQSLPVQLSFQNINVRNLQEGAPIYVDIMVVFTELAKNESGGLEKMNEDIELAIWQTNMSFENAGSNIRVRLATTIESRSFPDRPDFNALNALYDKNDGHFDEIDELRKEHGADVVILIASNVGGYCGIGKLGKPYSVVNRFCSTLSGQFSFAHEVGHQLFAFHDRETLGQRFTNDWPYQNYGYIDNEACFRTIMSYNRCTCDWCGRILYFSNQRTFYRGLPTGSEDSHNVDYMEQYAKQVMGVLMNPITDAPTESPYGPILAQSIPNAVELCLTRPCEDRPVLGSSYFSQPSGDGTGSAPNPPEMRVPMVRIKAGFFIEIFDRPNFKGSRRVLSSYGGDRTLQLASFKFSGKVRSWRVRKLSDRQVKLCRGVKCSEGVVVRRRTGSYRELPDEIKDSLTRITLPPRYRITIFDKTYFRGNSKTFTNSDYSKYASVKLFTGNNKKWNNAAKSMMIMNLRD